MEKVKWLECPKEAVYQYDCQKYVNFCYIYDILQADQHDDMPSASCYMMMQSAIYFLMEKWEFSKKKYAVR